MKRSNEMLGKITRVVKSSTMCVTAFKNVQPLISHTSATVNEMRCLCGRLGDLMCVTMATVWETVTLQL